MDTENKREFSKDVLNKQNKVTRFTNLASKCPQARISNVTSKRKNKKQQKNRFLKSHVN